MTRLKEDSQASQALEELESIAKANAITPAAPLCTRRPWMDLLFSLTPLAASSDVEVTFYSATTGRLAYVLRCLRCTGAGASWELASSHPGPSYDGGPPAPRVAPSQLGTPLYRHLFLPPGSGSKT